MEDSVENANFKHNVGLVHARETVLFIAEHIHQDPLYSPWALGLYACGFWFVGGSFSAS